MTESLRRPESVLVVVHTKALEILLLERVSPTGYWQSVTGSLEWDETPAEAARREIVEETGLPVTGLRDAGRSQRFAILPEWRAKFPPDTDTNLEHVWYLELPAIVDVTLNPDEHSRCEWLGFDAALERVSSWTNRDAIAALRR